MQHALDNPLLSIPRLRSMRADVIANRLVDVMMRMQSLIVDRRRMSGQVYGQRARDLLMEYRQLADRFATSYRPEVAMIRNRTVKVSITLPADQWDHIDALIASGRYRNRGHYFASRYMK